MSVQTIGSILWRKANFATENLGINALVYATPVFSLVWLYVSSEAHVPRADLLIIGAAAIITANLLINFEAEIGFGFKSLILALWACGAVVYLRPETWIWDGPGYFQALGLSATVFTLILAFRVARLVGRTSYEDTTTFAIFQNIDLLARRGIVGSNLRDRVVDLDSAQNVEDIGAAYSDVKQDFQAARQTAQIPENQQLLSETEASLDAVVHSKQQGSNFGEFFALIIFAVITVSLSILARPDLDGWTGFLIEMFTIPFSAVIIILTVNVWDFHRDRIGAILYRNPDHGWYGVLFRDSENRRFEQWISVVIGLAVTVAYAFLLWNKWLN